MLQPVVPAFVASCEDRGGDESNGAASRKKNLLPSCVAEVSLLEKELTCQLETMRELLERRCSALKSSLQAASEGEKAETEDSTLPWGTSPKSADEKPDSEGVTRVHPFAPPAQREAEAGRGCDVKGQAEGRSDGQDSDTESNESNLNLWSVINEQFGIEARISQAMEQRRRSKLTRIIRGANFSFLCTVVILANAIFVGIVADQEVRWEFSRLEGNARQKPDQSFLEAIFSVYFVIELILRIVAERIAFLFGRDARWNMFDAVVVIGTTASWLVSLGSRPSGDFNVSAWRVFRVLRVLRVFRVARRVPLIRNLQSMISSLVNCLSSFLPALCLLFLVMYIFGVAFMQAVIQRLHGMQRENASSEVMKDMYGGFFKTFWTVLGAISGGRDWWDTAEPIVAAGTFYGFLFLTYILFVLFGVLNILTGVVLNAAMNATDRNREIAMDQAMAKVDEFKKEMKTLFNEADEDRTGCISWKELMDFLQDEQIKAYFMALDMDMSSARKIFDLLPLTDKGEIQIEDLVECCVQFRGTAKNVDLFCMHHDLHKLLSRHGLHSSSFEMPSHKKHKAHKHSPSSQKSGLLKAALKCSPLPSPLSARSHSKTDG